MSKYLFEYKLI